MRATTLDSIIERFTEPEPNSGCVLWLGAINWGGYGKLALPRNGLGRRAKGRGLLAHRVLYEMVRGPIPQGLILNHLCAVRRCVNPAHLEPVTYRENSHYGPYHYAVRTHCKRGHPLSGENLVVRRDAGVNPSRRCRTCRNRMQVAADARLYAKKKARRIAADAS